jgi:hypothetical protein
MDPRYIAQILSLNIHSLTEFAVLAIQKIKPAARKAMMTPEEVDEVDYLIIFSKTISRLSSEIQG